VKTAEEEAMNHTLITFPDPVFPFEDSGEGGLYVMAVIPEPEGWKNRCHVDVSVSLHLSEPDVCLNSEQRDLWAFAEDARASHQKQQRASDMLRKQDKDLAAHIWQLASWDAFSLPLLAAVQLGSTQHSLWNSAEGQYWTAQQSDLTPGGRFLLGGLWGAFGIEPVLLTFLDT
jgi:hypothetical protein